MAQTLRPPAADPAQPERERVRQLVDAVLPSDAELLAFCQDCFPQVRERFTPQMDRAQRVELLLAQTARAVEVRLRAFAPNAKAWGPQHPRWPYVLVGLALCTALLGGFLWWRMTMARRPQGGLPAPGPAATLLLLPAASPWYGARHKEAPCCPPAPVPRRAAARRDYSAPG